MSAPAGAWRRRHGILNRSASSLHAPWFPSGRR